MPEFHDILSASEEELVQIFYRIKDDPALSSEEKLNAVAKKFRLRSAQLVCAVGFNPNAKGLTEIFPLLGFESFDELARQRNEIFTTDIYRQIPYDHIAAIYERIKDDPEMLQLMPYLLKARLKKVEGKIEETVNSIIIDKYKSEMRAIYLDHIATIEFVEERLDNTDSGFRALLNEVAIIIESKIIPTGDIFFRDSILPEEKRKLLKKGLIPIELVESRLQDEDISSEERKVLLEHIRQNRMNR